ncbi:MAG: thio(seleno)oxazole modification radical SAM maturase SbtM [Deltaproteobacteria bacterium]|nr:thio(seleno)oxazole modification radical SAM maturase SbtM [Deltaproteobacteria bacterium]
MSESFVCLNPEFFPACRRLLGGPQWQGFLALLAPAGNLADLAGLLADPAFALEGVPGYLSDLARLELALCLAQQERPLPAMVERLTVNPSLQLLQSSWAGLPHLLGENGARAVPQPVPQQEIILVWVAPETGKSQAQAAGPEDLLALKLVSEGIDPRQAAALGELSVGAIEEAIERAANKGLLLVPASRLRRDEESFPITEALEPRFMVAEVFTLQWHITQVCDLHCKHCYDRSDRAPLSLAQGLAVLDDLLAFCQSRHVRGQVSFSGGNPLLYPYFLELYQAAVDRGFTVAILGNATAKERLLPVLAIEKPAFCQVSLEGLPEHNDFIRGTGYFARVMEFLDLLRELDIYSMVMLTLTRGNMEQVLPLAELLRDRVDLFVFNRLAMVGEGSLLESVPIAEYRGFLERYLVAARENPGMGLKDNLFNLLRAETGEPLLGGCAGFGCGAAFNFVSLLPDGEVHACRKFPSFIGNIFTQSLAEIYDAPTARQYRAGCQACRDCRLRPACGGCLAVSHGFGLDVFSQRDPYCFLVS